MTVVLLMMVSSPSTLSTSVGEQLKRKVVFEMDDITGKFVRMNWRRVIVIEMDDITGKFVRMNWQHVESLNSNALDNYSLVSPPCIQQPFSDSDAHCIVASLADWSPGEYQVHRTELDSHADTSACVDSCFVVEDSGTYVTIDGFDASRGSLHKVPICTLAIAYDCPKAFITYVLFLHQTLHIKGMTTNLLSTFQLRQGGVTIHEVPLQLLEPEDCHSLAHSITTDEVHIPLTLKGTMPGFDTCKPMLTEVQDIIGVTCIHVHFTPTDPWDPQASLYGDVEELLCDTMPILVLQLYPLQLRGLSMESEVEQETFDCTVPLAKHPDVEAMYHYSALDTSD
jgi:hypothetical protein